MAFIGGFAATFEPRKIDVGAIGELLECLHELDAIPAHDEIDGIAAGLAAEAVEELAIRVNAEAGRLLLVEGAKAAIPAAGAFELDRLADEFDDVGGLQDLCFVIDASAQWVPFLLRACRGKLPQRGGGTNNRVDERRKRHSRTRRSGVSAFARECCRRIVPGRVQSGYEITLT